MSSGATMLFRTFRQAGLAAIAVLPFATGGQAADAGRGPSDRDAAEGRRSVIVVQDCRVHRDESLLGCAPREETGWTDDIGLQQVLRSVERPRQTPYPQLLDRP